MLGFEIVNMRDYEWRVAGSLPDGSRLTRGIFNSLMNDAFRLACEGIDNDTLIIGFYYFEKPDMPIHTILAKTVVDGSTIDCYFYYDCDPDKLIRKMNIGR